MIHKAPSGAPVILVPVGILAEISYLIERRVPRALDPFLADLASGAFTPDCGLDELARVRQLVSRYAELPLGYADAAVIACAERRGQRVLTLDAHLARPCRGNPRWPPATSRPHP